MNIFYSFDTKSSFEFLRYVGENYYGVKIVKSDIAIGTDGKPFLKNGAFKYNISHTDGAIILAAAKSEVGIDVEKIRPRNYMPIVKRYFPEVEACPLEDFYSLWTKKESFVKYLGSSVFKIMNDIRLEGDALTYKGEKQKLKRFTMFLGDEHVFSVCGKDDEIYLFYLENY